MSRPVSNYQSYLVRFWRMDNAGQPVWRASLQEPGSEQQCYFESFADLCAYLAARLEQGEAGSTAGADPAGRPASP